MKLPLCCQMIVPNGQSSLSRKKTNVNDDQYIVINASVGISESYVATPEKEAAIKIANEKMAKGDKKGAMEELRLAVLV